MQRKSIQHGRLCAKIRSGDGDLTPNSDRAVALYVAL